MSKRRKKAAERDDQPTAVLPPPEAPAKPQSYHTQVYQSLIKLGVSQPGPMLDASGDYWKHCQELTIAPQVCAAMIYGTERHKHHVTSTTINEAKEGSAEEEVAPADKKTERAALKKLFKAADDADAAAKAAPSLQTHKTAEDAARAAYNAASRFYRTYGTRSVHDDGQVYSSFTRFHQAKREELERAERVKRVDVTQSPEFRAARHAKDGELLADLAHRASHPAVYMTGTDPARARKLAEDYTRQAIEQFEAANALVPDEKYQREIDHLRSKLSPTAAEEDGDPSAMAEEMPRGPGGVQSQIAAKTECETCIPWRKVSRDPVEAADIAKLDKTVSTPLDVFACVGADLNRETQEVFLVLPVNIHGKLMGPAYEVARGQRDRVAVGIDNVMDAASDARCAGYLVVHQHPGGSPRPSKADVKLTEDIRKATPPGRKFLDHVIIGPDSAYSCIEKKLYRVKK